jgi:hypothetical protein
MTVMACTSDAPPLPFNVLAHSLKVVPEDPNIGDQKNAAIPYSPCVGNFESALDVFQTLPASEPSLGPGLVLSYNNIQ